MAGTEISRAHSPYQAATMQDGIDAEFIKPPTAYLISSGFIVPPIYCLIKGSFSTSCQCNFPTIHDKLPPVFINVFWTKSYSTLLPLTQSSLMTSGKTGPQYIHSTLLTFTQSKQQKVDAQTSKERAEGHLPAVEWKKSNIYNLKKMLFISY